MVNKIGGWGRIIWPIVFVQEVGIRSWAIHILSIPGLIIGLLLPFIVPFWGILLVGYIIGLWLFDVIEAPQYRVCILLANLCGVFLGVILKILYLAVF